MNRFSWKTVIVVGVLTIIMSLPLSIYFSGRVRDDQQATNQLQDHKLCAYQQRQWVVSNLVILRFTRPNTDDQQFLLDLAGPKPTCSTTQ